MPLSSWSTLLIILFTLCQKSYVEYLIVLGWFHGSNGADSKMLKLRHAAVSFATKYSPCLGTKKYWNNIEKNVAVSNTDRYSNTT